MNDVDLIIATHNDGKLREINVLLSGFGLRTLGAAAALIREPEETGATFEANATLKAIAAANAGVAALADDSGICVEALGGDPGINTARWAGEPRDFAVARKRVHDALAQKSITNARATWVTVFALARPDGQCSTTRGEARGRLVWPERRNNGFGFEPIFLPDGFAITYSEMTPELKRQVNARASAFRQLLPTLRSLQT